MILIENKVARSLTREQAARISMQMRKDGISEINFNARFVVGWFGAKLAVPQRGWIDDGLGKTTPLAKGGGKRQTRWLDSGQILGGPNPDADGSTTFETRDRRG